MHYLRTLGILFIIIFLGACSSLQLARYQYNQTTQPVYIAYGTNYDDGILQERLKQTLISYGIKTTDNRQQAHTIISVSDTHIGSEKSIKNNFANNNSIFYQATLSTELAIQIDVQKKQNHHQHIQAKTPVIVLENQNIFSSDVAGSTIYHELQIDLIDQIISQISQLKLGTPSKKTI